MAVHARHCRFRPRFTVVFCLTAAAALAGCSRSKGAGGPGGRRGSGPTVEVRTSTVQRMSIQRTVDLAGTLLSPDQAKVSAEAPGVVRKVLVEIGSDVKAGQPL